MSLECGTGKPPRGRSFIPLLLKIGPRIVMTCGSVVSAGALGAVHGYNVALRCERLLLVASALTIFVLIRKDPADDAACIGVPADRPMVYVD